MGASVRPRIVGTVATTLVSASTGWMMLNAIVLTALVLLALSIARYSITWLPWAVIWAVALALVPSTASLVHSPATPLVVVRYSMLARPETGLASPVSAALNFTVTGPG